MTPRRILASLYRAALAGVEPQALVSGWLQSGRLSRPRGGRLGVFSAGKAALGMARGVPGLLPEEYLVVVPRDAPAGKFPGRILRGAHPFPDSSSLAAASDALRFFQRFGAGDTILSLVSGGASSLLCLPREGMTLAAKRRRIVEAQRAGWPIEKLNRLRSSLSRVKGGRLADSTRARVITLVLSDMPGSDFRLVGSGPTVSRRKRADRAFLLAGNVTGISAAAARAREMGLPLRRERRLLTGEAREAGRLFARRLNRLGEPGGHEGLLLLAGGETTVTLSGRTGRGGRCQEFALAAAEELAGRDGVILLAAASDGRDGDSDNAGAFADGGTVERARAQRLDSGGFLRRHASAEFFEELGDAVRVGATGTNVADWVFGLRLK